jgi:RNA polymerase primary sigma factor
MEDLVGEGNLGLIRAVEGFDPRFGTRFSTYAAYWIKDAILSALINTTATIRVPSHMVRLLAKWRKAEQALDPQGVCPPTFEEVATELGLSMLQKELVAKARQATQLRLESGLPWDSYYWAEGKSLVSPQPPEALLETRDERLVLLQRMDRLDCRERLVLTLRFGLCGEMPRSLLEVSRRLGLAREWVRRITMRALLKLDSGLATDPAVLDMMIGRRPKPALSPRRAPSVPLCDGTRPLGDPSATRRPREASPLVPDSRIFARCG